MERHALQLCLESNWIFNCKMTELFIVKPWLKMPDEWLETLSNMNLSELNRLVQCKTIDEWPHSLKEFCFLVDKLTERYNTDWNKSVIIPDNIKRGMREKKQHEISRMAPLIQDKSVRKNCTAVADIGCGLGYLGQTLASLYNIDVQGFELKGSNCQGARKVTSHITGSNSATEQLLVDQSPECTETLRHAFTSHHDKNTQLNNSNPSEESIENSHLDREDRDCRICMVGLHCCGDLTPSTIMQFCSITECKVLICMGCCYHRLSSIDSSFVNFPMSAKLKRDYNKLTQQYGCKLNSLAFRLACQETKSRWLKKTDLEIEEHSKHVAFRAVLEHYCKYTGSTLSKKHKKLVGSKAFSSFETYVDALLDRVEGFTSSDTNQIRLDLVQSYKECEPYFCHIRWYNALQVMMQGLLESVILRDRQAFLNEKGIHCELYSVFDDLISPRNIALVAWK